MKMKDTIMIIIVVLVVLTVLYWLFTSMKHNVHESFYDEDTRFKDTPCMKVTSDGLTADEKKLINTLGSRLGYASGSDRKIKCLSPFEITSFTPAASKFDLNPNDKNFKSKDGYYSFELKARSSNNNNLKDKRIKKYVYFKNNNEPRPYYDTPTPPPMTTTTPKPTKTRKPTTTRSPTTTPPPTTPSIPFNANLLIEANPESRIIARPDAGLKKQCDVTSDDVNVKPDCKNLAEYCSKDSNNLLLIRNSYDSNVYNLECINKKYLDPTNKHTINGKFYRFANCTNWPKFNSQFGTNIKFPNIDDWEPDDTYRMRDKNFNCKTIRENPTYIPKGDQLY